MLIEVIQRGDTLYNLAHRYGISAENIAKANGISESAQLVVGQSLVIPTTGRYHTVQPGETLWQIARHYGTTADALIQANQIQNPAHLQVGQRLIIPHGSRPQIETNGYITKMTSEGVQRVKDVGKDLTYLTPFSYHVKSDGTLKSINDSGLLRAAKAKQVAPLMVITNFTSHGFSSDLAHTILSNKDLQDKLLTNVLKIMKQKGYKGLNIDFEYVYPRDRTNYNNFLSLVVDKLHPHGYSVSTALAPKHSGNQQGTLYEAHDYPFHGKTADFVILMTYEWGWAGGPAGPISPIPQMRRVLDYAVSVIPRNKILMGVSTYGRDWPLPFVAGQTKAKTIGENEAVDLARTHHVSIQYDFQAQAPHFRYSNQQGKAHEVWYEDARSVQAKYELVKEYGLRGLSYWVLNYPFPQSWLLLEDNFRIKKI